MIKMGRTKVPKLSVPQYLTTPYQREELQRQEKIEDWERHKKGMGYRSKSSRPTAETSSKSSKTLKPENFSPLMGHGSSGGTLFQLVSFSLSTLVS